MDKKIWLITGISSGLGKSLAAYVMDQGDFVIGTFRSQHQVDEFKAKHQGDGDAFLLDIKNGEEMHSMVRSILSQYAKIDVLVNNAGVGFVGAVEETSMEEVRAVFEANFFGTLNLTNHILPSMRREGKGHIVQISSHGGVKAFAGFGIYNASKFALEGFSEALAQEVGPLGIGVTIVEPGPFRTNFAGNGLGIAANVIEDYEETAGAFKTKLLSVDGKQEGDPDKAAEAIFAHINGENSSLRLPLGKIPIATIGMKIESLQSDLSRNRAIAERAVF